MSVVNNQSPTIRELFAEWDIPESVTSNFIGNGITLELLKTLSADILKELCPHITTRLNLQQHIDTLLVQNRNDNGEDVDVNTSDDETDNQRRENATEAEVDDEIDYFPSLDLMKQIKASPEGPIILEDYEQNGKLNPTSQQSVVDIIGRFLFPWLEKNVMKNCHYRCLLNKIKETFPNECLSVYFIKPVPKRLSPTNKPIPMRGKLPDKIRNTRFTSGMSKSKKKRRINVFDLSIEDKRRRYNELSEDHVHDVEWLKENYQPWDTVIEKWRSTHEIRSCCTHKTVAEFFNEWPILNDLRGKDLIFMDFACMYPDKINLLRSSWPTFFDRIKTLRSLKYASDETIQSYKELISTLENEVESINLKFVIELLMLPYLVPPKGRNSKKIKHSRREASDSIVLFVKNPGDIDTEIEKQKARAYNKNDTVQPYVLIQGGMEEHNQVLLVVDDVKYQFTSAMTACDCLFKCFHVFGAQYPKDSKHIYLLIQRCIFKIKTQYDILPTTITDIDATFERL